MDRFELSQVLSGFQDRMAKVALFDPLFELQRKKQTDADGHPIDMMELGLLTLLFFFEQKLLRNAKVGVQDLGSYLYQVMEDKLNIDITLCQDLARSIIQVYRPASGKKRSFTFFNWETKQHEEVYTSILKANAFDAKTQTQYYALDEDGLELIFATKEFYAEFQLSIHQLVLRKQLEKGEFQGALRQINEMRVDVETLQERMIKLEHEIKRSIVSEETLKRYSGLLEDIYIRLQRENEEFEELRQFVKETRERLYMDTRAEKQQRAYEYVLRIASELEKVHGEHTGLLQQSMDLKGKALHSAKESLYYTGLNSFNFEQDIAGHVLSSPLPLESLKGVTAPFIGLEQHRSWSLLTVFAEQQIYGEGEQAARDEAFLDAAEEDSMDSFHQRRGVLFTAIMQFLLDELAYRDDITLDELFDKLKKQEHARWLTLRSFYDFWLILHQRSPVSRVVTEQEEGASGMEECLSLLGKRVLVVEEASGILQADPRYQVQNMKISWEGEF
jgi:hypothetical protein